MRGRTGGRVIVSVIALLPILLSYVLNLFCFLLIPFPDAFFALWALANVIAFAV